MTIQNAIPFANKPIQVNISLPGSKSLANRALIIAALADGKSCIKNMLFSDDIEACLMALGTLGIQVDVNRKDASVNLIGGNGHFCSGVDIYARDAGTVARFLLPACATAGGEYSFSASKRMSERPMGVLFDILSSQGVKFHYQNKKGYLPVTFESFGLSGGYYQIPGKQSSQFLSGLLISSVYAKSKTILESNVLHQQPYVAMTVEIMKSFGIAISREGNQYYIEAGQSYKGIDYTLEPDVSTASYFWALAALTQGSVMVRNINFNCSQGDIKFLNVLEKMGCTVLEKEEGILVKGPEQLIGVSVNMRSFSDTFMTLSTLACFAKGETYITGIAHTRLQESDRIEAMAQGLRQLGAIVITSADSILIKPSDLHGGIVSGCNDHRIAMSLALMGVKVPNVIIDGADCVKKTCPDYFERMQSIVK